MEDFKSKKINKLIGNMNNSTVTTNFLSGDDAEEKLGSDISVALVWKQFESFTTSHGIGHIGHARGNCKKTIWIFFSILSFIGLGINFYLLVAKYLEYNVDVSIKIEQAKAIVFPAVTICNNNPIRRSRFIKNANFKNIMTAYKHEINGKKCQTLMNAGQNTSVSKRASLVQCVPTFGLTEDGRKQRSDYRLMTQIQEKFLGMTKEEKLEVGHDITSTIFDCEFLGGMCDLKNDFKYISNNYYGNCFTFNSGINNILKMSRRAGPRFGLSITFNVEQDEYIGEISHSAGLRVVVHDPRRMPFPEDEGILVAPTALTHIGVTMIKSHKLNGSYGNCYAEGLEKRTVYQDMFNLSYCEKGCQYTCLSREIIRRCHCGYAKFPMEIVRESSLRPCVHDDKWQNTCVDSVWWSYENGSLKCDPSCPVPCRETLYKATVSSEIWPARNYKDVLRNFLESRSSSSNDSVDFDNYGKFVVYFQDLAYESIYEFPAYELHDLMSDIGGVLGLYIGFSLLTFVEFIELLYDLCCICFYKASRKSNRAAQARAESATT